MSISRALTILTSALFVSLLWGGANTTSFAQSVTVPAESEDEDPCAEDYEGEEACEDGEKKPKAKPKAKPKVGEMESIYWARISLERFPRNG